MPRLLILSPDQPLRTRAVTRDVVRVGSLGLNDVALAGRGIEAEHLEIRFETPDRITFRRLGEAPGIRVNGSSLERGVVRPGDVMEVGDHKLLIDVGPSDRGDVLRVSEGLFDLASQVMEEAPHKAILKRMLDVLLEIYSASRALVVEVSDEGSHTRVLTKIGDWPRGETPRVSRTLLSKLHETLRPILIADVLTDPDVKYAESISITVRSMMAGPVLVDDDIVGVIYLEGSDRAEAFGEEDRVFMQRLCAFAGRLLANRDHAQALEGEARRLMELHRLSLEGAGELTDIVGQSDELTEVRNQILQVGPTQVTAMILGESGTGKELVARAIHCSSPRKERPFVAVNCTALPDTLAESELFGHVAGAFSGASRDRPGRFELAHQGTLFLDEVGDLSVEVQGKLLRALQERVIQRVGEGTDREVDVRIVAATNAPLADRIREGRFREDLYYRLGVFTIRVPPLRERRQDILPLARTFLESFCSSLGRRPPTLSPESERVLEDHAWPGNVRELKNVIQQAVVRESGALIQPKSLEVAMVFSSVRTPETEFSLVGTYGETFELARSRFEIAFLEEQLLRHDGDVGRVLEAAGMSKATFYRRCAALGIDPKGFR